LRNLVIINNILKVERKYNKYNRILVLLGKGHVNIIYYN
jgi:hypothetical protein